MKLFSLSDGAFSSLPSTTRPLWHCWPPPLLQPANLTELYCLWPSPLQPSVLCVHSGSRGQSRDDTSQGITPLLPPLTRAFYKDTLIFSLSSPLLPPPVSSSSSAQTFSPTLEKEHALRGFFLMQTNASSCFRGGRMKG